MVGANVGLEGLLGVLGVSGLDLALLGLERTDRLSPQEATRQGTFLASPNQRRGSRHNPKNLHLQGIPLCDTYLTSQEPLYPTLATCSPQVLLPSMRAEGASSDLQAPRPLHSML